MDMDFVNSNTEEVYIGTNYQEDGHEEGQDKMDVTVDPAEVPEAVHRLIVKESVHKKRAENNEPVRIEQKAYNNETVSLDQRA